LCYILPYMIQSEQIIGSTTYTIGNY
jgi:hypothetical protein